MILLDENMRPTTFFIPDWRSSRFQIESAGRLVTQPDLGEYLQEPLNVAEASRPGTGMYGGNLELVSRRENVQVFVPNICTRYL